MTYRPVTVVFSDSIHVLHLVEVRMDIIGSIRVDHKKAETEAYVNAAIHGRDMIDWHLVGVLIAQTSGLHRGRIIWAEDYARNKKEYDNDRRGIETNTRV